ncbi:MAG: GldG family protein [Spirochaetaceae bacterium]|jgi:ABC-type uncharacterized transport system involved in gliding motility auxiliary subunit|nr:GldG family protein [Spirochaetaceae bacterium]
MNKQQTIVTSALSLVIIILVLLVSGRVWTRLDLTENKSWTISPVSKKLADELTDQVQISYFVTDKLKKLYGFPREIEDLVKEYVSFSRGKISFVEIDPARAGLETTMQELGIPYQEFQLIEKDQASFSNVYSGILIEYQNKREVLPFVFRLNTLEYEITNRIRGMVREKENSIGIVVGDVQNAFSNDNEYRNVQQFLSQAGYKVRTIVPGDEIPDTLSGLVVIGGASQLDDWALYRIDRYIQLGGKVFFAISSVSVSTQNSFSAGKIEDSGLLKMIGAYGVDIAPQLALDISSLSLPSTLPGFGGLRVPVPYPFFVHVGSDFASRAHPVTAAFKGADLYWPSPLFIAAPSGVEAEALFTTSEEGWLQTNNFIIDPQMKEQFLQEQDATRGEYVLAAALSGVFPSYWRNKEKPERADSGETLPDMPRTGSPSRIVVVGNTDFLMGNVDFVFNRYKQTQPNFDFAVLAADWLCNDDDIISIRARASSTGALDKIINDEKRISAFSLARAINTVFVPLLVLAAGIALSLRRKKTAGQFSTPANEG